MRLRHLVTPLAIGLAAHALIRRHGRRRRGAARTEGLAADPGDPVQGLDEAPDLQIMPLEVDAVSHADAEAEQDLASLETDIEEAAEADAAMLGMAGEETEGSGAEAAIDEPARPRDAGDLYGAHTPAAMDRVHPDDDRAFESGQNWIEALETSAIESGPEPERELDDIVDDEDVLHPPHASDTRDKPIADLGSAGRRGL